MTDIRCQSLVFDYPGGVRALDDVSLVIPGGQRAAIVGQNGSGKTTLVRHFNGLLRPLSGSLWVGGRDSGRLRVAELSRLVGLSFQDPDRQIFAGNVESEVEFGPRNLGLRGRALEDAVAAAMAAVGLAAERSTNPYDLGYSQRKLLAIASVLAMGTPIVVLDEPTTGQDARGLRRVQALVAQLASEGRTVVAVSHDLRFVAESFERVIVMGSGRIVLDGSPADAFGEHNWAALRSTNLEPTYAARAGHELGLGSTPTDASVVEALRYRAGERHRPDESLGR